MNEPRRLVYTYSSNLRDSVITFSDLNALVVVFVEHLSSRVSRGALRSPWAIYIGSCPWATRGYILKDGKA